MRLDAESETFVTHTLRAEGHDGSEDGTGRGVPLVPVPSSQIVGALMANGNRTGGDRPPGSGADSISQLVPVAYRTTGNDGAFETGDRVGALNTATDQNQSVLVHQMAVRRLTPRECERLQGFPDDYTRVVVRGKPAADGPRYRALGNSMAVPVMAYIGERIAEASRERGAP